MYVRPIHLKRYDIERQKAQIHTHKMLRLKKKKKTNEEKRKTHMQREEVNKKENVY